VRADKTPERRGRRIPEWLVVMAFHLRWRKEDGTTGLLTRGGNGVWTSTLGWTGRPDGKHVSFDCVKDTINFDGVLGRQIPLEVKNVTFQGAGVRLAGRLVMPQGTGRVPIVILVHGSEHDSALKSYSLQRQLPADGIGVFVYDKRGTGKSGGVYTQNYLLLADDVIAAMNEAKRLAGTRAGRIGYQGGSQGGWPLGMPLLRKMEAGLWEVRSTTYAGIARVLFTTIGPVMVLLHGFVKKTAKTPPDDLKLASRRMKEVHHG
jgi:phage-related protein